MILGHREKPAAPDHLEKKEIPTVLSKAETSTNEQQRWNLRQEYERKFEQLSEDQKLSKLCSDAGLKLVEREQYFYTLEAEEGQQMEHLCREYTLPRTEEGTRVRGWTRSKTRFGPVLNIKVCHRDEQKSVEVQVPSLFQDNTVSWVRILTALTDTWQNQCRPRMKRTQLRGNPLLKQDQDRSLQWRWFQFLFLFLKGYGSTLKQKESLDCRDMINQFLEESTEQSTTMTSLKSAGGRSSTTLRSGYLKIGYQGLAKGGGAKKRFQYCVNPTSPNQFLYLRAIQGHSRESAIDPALQDNILIPKDLPSISITSGTRTNWILQ